MILKNLKLKILISAIVIEKYLIYIYIYFNEMKLVIFDKKKNNGNDINDKYK